MVTSVERSWQKLQRIGIDHIGELLFQDLFENAPEAQDLFPPDVRLKYREWTDEESDGMPLRQSPSLKNLSAKVVTAIGYAVVGLHDVERLVPKLRELGVRHFGYGVAEKHLQQLGKSLMRVLRHCLGDAFTKEVEFSWNMVYSYIHAIMLSGWHDARSLLSNKRHGNPQVAAAPVEVQEQHHHQHQKQHRQVHESNPVQSQEVAEGCEIIGGLEVYRIDQHLQKAIFGDVFSATGLASGRHFAIKVLDRGLVQRFSDLQIEDHQFCESPLSEVQYAEMMEGLDNVVQLEDHFSDDSSHFIVSNLAVGGDLLEALRLRPGGFEELQAREAVRGTATGLASLHQRGMAMQDVSLENCLVFVLPNEEWSVHVCDPGQACAFTFDPVSGEEVPVEFHGFVAKEFRPPELYEKQEYLASKVDSWCLGWSTFYLLCAQPLFHSADPSEPDPDFILFQTRPSKLFSFKGWSPSLSPQAEDFIHKLMHIDPQQRMSVSDALRHPWLAEGPSSSTSVVRAGAAARKGQQPRTNTVFERVRSHDDLPRVRGNPRMGGA